MTRKLYIGLMSGTSLDGVDGVLVDFGGEAGVGQTSNAWCPSICVRAHAHRPFDVAWRAELLALNTSGADELHRAALAGNAVAAVYADVVEALLRSASIERAEVTAIGAHGQTVRHRPHEFDATGYTWQLGAPALLAESTGIDVVADFRSRDIAAGGQGAPLVPAFHRAAFGRTGEPLAVLNIGGISNLTAIDAGGATSGFDCGPGNALLDGWCEAHIGSAYDDKGAWGATSAPNQALLRSMLAEPYFDAAPPKSTGRDLFSLAWLQRHVDASGATLSGDAAEVQATLSELTARICAVAVDRHAPKANELLVCGGGAFNDDLMRRLSGALPSRRVQSTSSRGLPPDQVEATAFAWLAGCFVEHEPANLPAATGARGPRMLGAFYPA